MRTFIFISLFLTLNAFAEGPASCVLTVNREACPGREQEAYAPYGGVNPTQEQPIVKNQADCLSRAPVLSKILRKRVIKKITVTPSFGGQSFAPVTSEDRCSVSQKKL